MQINLLLFRSLFISYPGRYLHYKNHLYPPKIAGSIITPKTMLSCFRCKRTGVICSRPRHAKKHRVNLQITVGIRQDSLQSKQKVNQSLPTVMQREYEVHSRFRLCFIYIEDIDMTVVCMFVYRVLSVGCLFFKQFTDIRIQVLGILRNFIIRHNTSHFAIPLRISNVVPVGALL